MTEGMIVILVASITAALGQIVTFLTLLVNSRNVRLKEERQRKWDVEDRAALAAKVVIASTQLAAKAKAQHDELTTAIAENTAKTEQAVERADAAYTEANHVNIKIADLNTRLVEDHADKRP